MKPFFLKTHKTFCFSDLYLCFSLLKTVKKEEQRALVLGEKSVPRRNIALGIRRNKLRCYKLKMNLQNKSLKSHV